jgi:succinate dehydrogenase / fumarate reductase cytochrome b subunit
MSKSVLLSSSLAKKYWMALTGLFLCLFLVGHLAGNLQLLMPFGSDAMYAFNEYAHFMTTNPLIKVMSYLTYFSILFHAIDGFLLVYQNRKARPVKYQKFDAGKNSSSASRMMAILGTFILIFIVTHMVNFWARMHFDDMPTVPGKDGGEKLKDLYGIVIAFFRHPDYGIVATLLYALSMVVLGFHLSHGFQSAFQSLGIRHKKYTPIIKKAGMAFAILVPLGFAVIPLYIHFALEGAMVEQYVKTILSK